MHPETGSDDTLAGEGALASRSHGELVRTTAVGRYVVLSRIGSGGMGVVYAAYDPELDRKVALKLLRPEERRASSSGGPNQLLREAQAMARLSHPNVIAVHDVGEHEGRVYLAMEFVEGATLKGWRAAARRRWQDVLDVCLAAGRGLAAAHDVGLVHRDFKPDNVMVGNDGRVRVMDFGLARRSTLAPDEVAATDSASPAPGVTHDGAIAGTPAYMAPEQHLGLPVGPAADQFAFCVTLWEALFDARPFVGDTLPELALNVCEGRRRPAPPGSSVPAWLRRACERGLDVAPERRFTDMHELVAVLQRGQARARFRFATAGAAVLALSSLGVVVYGRWVDERAVAACESDGARIDEVWNPERRQALHDALVGTGIGYAEATTERMLPLLDAHAQEWAEGRVEACRRATIENTWDATTYARSEACFDDQRADLDALITEIERAGPRVLQRAVPAAAKFRGPDACFDTARLPAQPDEGDREAVRAIEANLSRVGALLHTGEVEEGLALARTAFADADQLGWPPLRASARVWLGTLAYEAGSYADAERELEAAYFEAAGTGATGVALEAADMLVVTVGYHQHRYAEGLRWAKHTELLRASLPDPAGLRRATSSTRAALVHRAKGDFEEARKLLEDALAIQVETIGAEHVLVAETLTHLANVRQAMGDLDDARALHERAVEVTAVALGPEHPNVAASLGSLANTLSTLGDNERALDMHARALAIFENSLGPDHLMVAISAHNLALVHAELGHDEEARASYRRAMAIFERVYGPEHPSLAASLDALGRSYTSTGDYDEAQPLAERALAMREKALGPDHLDVAASLTTLGSVLARKGEHTKAVSLLERSLAIREQKLGADHRDAAGARFVLARALWESGTDRERSIAEAKKARDAHRRAGKGSAKGLADVEAWLAEHG